MVGTRDFVNGFQITTVSPIFSFFIFFLVGNFLLAIFQEKTFTGIYRFR